MTPLSTTALLALATAAALVATATPVAAAERPAPRPGPGQARLGGTTAGRASLAMPGRTRLAVTLAPGADENAVLAVAGSHGATLRKRIPALGVVSIEVPERAASRVAEALERRADVRGVAPVQTRRTSLVPNDTHYAAIQSGYLGEVNAAAAWDITTGSADVLVAVIDSGVDVAHEDLSAKIAGKYNAVTGTADVTDAMGHGTAVAGVAAASTGNGKGIAGAGYDSRILAVKVADSQGGISTDAEADGIVWAADHGADVINISLGGATPDATESAAIAYAQNAGAIVVASAGNESTSAESYPAAYTGVIAAGATDASERASFSNYGSWVDVGAPGVDIAAPASGGGYQYVDGTSFSSPLVAGEVALLRALYPTLSASAIASAVSTTTTGSYGFAAGRVDFAAALAQPLPATTPVFTAPEDAATVGGDVTVTATSPETWVRFAIDGGPTTTVPVSDGSAAATLETFGLSGARTITATACNATGCALSGATRSVTVDNGVPTITAPAADATIGTATFLATATTPAGEGGVRFYVDGVSKAFDGAAPYEATLGTTTLADGAHTLTAVLCNRAGTTCDTANPSAAVAFVVDALHPSITSVAPSPFSPNGDKALDTTTLTYTLDATQTVVLSIRNAGGTVVRSGSFGTKAAGTHTWVWNGKKADGTALADGTYTVELATSSGDLSGFTSKTVKLDKTAPLLSSVSGHGTTFHPVADGYQDTFAPAVTLNETARLYLYVYNSAGKRVRVVDGGVKNAGRWAITWNGRTSGGSLLPAGTYRYLFTARDTAQNVRSTGRYTVYTTAKKLAARTATKTVTPMGTRKYDMFGVCGMGFTPARDDWSGSISYISGFQGCADPSDNLAAVEHAYALPSAIKYGSVRVAATGAQTDPTYADVGFLLYLDKTQTVTDIGATLGSAYGTYWAPSVSAANTLSGGRVVRWVAGTLGGNWYDVRTFTVKWTYYVLV